jgi:deoxycytidine triphosphate deaminase
MSGVLSDHEIRKMVGKYLMIEPFESAMIRPSSIRLRLDSSFLVMRERGDAIDTRSSDTKEWFERVETGGGHFLLQPRTFVLGASLERIGLPTSLTGFLNTISSLARVGLTTHGSSGLVPAGYGEQAGAKITFELFSYGSSPIVLYPGMPVCHLTLVRNTSPAKHGYEAGGGFYRGLSVEPADFQKHPAK